MIATTEKQYRGVLGLSICFPRQVLSTENSNSEQILFNKWFEQRRKHHCTAREEPDLFGVFFVEQADSTVTVVVQRRQAGLQGEPCGCNAHKEL